MPQPEHISSLDTILAFTQAKMQQLLQILKIESALMEKNNIHELESITLEKVQLTEQIKNNENERIRFLQAKNLNPSEPTQWLNNPRLVLIWQKIKTLSEQSQRQNLINGLVINNNRRRVQTLLEILNSAPVAELVYSATGKSVNLRNTKSLARA